MDFHEYRQEFLSSVRIAAESDQESTVTSFVKEAADTLLEAGVIPDYEPCFYIGNGKHNRRLRVDGYALDDYDMTMYLLVADFSGTDEVETLTMTRAKMVFDRLYAFIEQAMIGELHNELEISTPVYDLVESLRINELRIRRFSLILVTDKKASEKIETLPFREMQNIQVEYHIWDMNRFFKVADTESGRSLLHSPCFGYLKSEIYLE